MAQAQERRRAGLRRLDDRQVRALLIGADRGRQLAECRMHPLLDIPTRLLVGRAHPPGPARCDDVERRQEALLLVGELLIEGATRHAREADDLPDARALIPVARDSLDHRPMHPAALVVSDRLGPEPVRAVGQTGIQRGWWRRRGVAVSSRLVGHQHSCSRNRSVKLNYLAAVSQSESFHVRNCLSTANHAAATGRAGRFVPLSQGPRAGRARHARLSAEHP
jgi:hypothetical protein